MTAIRIGVIGAGVLGCYHIEKCLKAPGVRLAGFHDANPTRCREVHERYGIRSFDSVGSLLPEIGAAIIATPCSTHADIGRQCLDARKHVLIEKPLADSYAAGSMLVGCAEAGGLVLHVGHSEVFNPAFQRLVSLNPAPRFMEIHRLAAFSPRGTDVSVIFDLMVHDLHLVLRLCKEEPLHDAIAAVGVPVVSRDIDIANVRLAFPSGCVVNLTASRISSKRMRKIRVFQKDNYYSVDLDEKDFTHYFLTPGAGGSGVAVARRRETLPPRDALEAELGAFVSAIQGTAGTGPGEGTAGREALAVLKVCDSIMSRLAATPELH